MRLSSVVFIATISAMVSFFLYAVASCTDSKCILTMMDMTLFIFGTGAILFVITWFIESSTSREEGD